MTWSGQWARPARLSVRRWLELQPRSSTVRRARLDYKPPLMRNHDRTAYREPHSHAALLRRRERGEEPLAVTGIDAGTRVLHPEYCHVFHDGRLERQA